jgi:hypothetical protein
MFAPYYRQSQQIPARKLVRPVSWRCSLFPAWRN